jgi:hypothetical protein
MCRKRHENPQKMENSGVKTGKIFKIFLIIPKLCAIMRETAACMPLLCHAQNSKQIVSVFPI